MPLRACPRAWGPHLRRNVQGHTLLRSVAAARRIVAQSFSRGCSSEQGRETPAGDGGGFLCLGFRSLERGWRSNDVESELSRLKGWLRGRYGRLPRTLSEDFSGDLFEYMLLVNEHPEWMDLLKVFVKSY